MALAAALFAWMPAESAQPPQGKGEKVPPPDWMLFETAFRRIELQERSSSQAVAQGWPNAVARAQYAREAEFAEPEYSAVVKIGLSCLRQVSEIDRQSKELMKLASQERKQTGGKTSSYDSRIEAQFDLREPAIRKAMKDIADALGEASYQRYYRYLREKIAPTMSVYKL